MQRYCEKDEVCECNTCYSKFVTVPLGPQLKARLESKHLRPKCKLYHIEPGVLNTVLSTDTSPTTIKDIHGEKKYQEMQRSIAGNKITLVLNTDGVQLFRSSIVSSIWPIWVLINELPVTVRYKLLAIALCISDLLWISPN